MPDFLTLAPEFQLSPVHWLLVLLCAVIIGAAKAGIKGITIVVVALLAIIFGGKASTGILLPLLIAGDTFAVWYYNRHTQWKYLIRLLPWAMLGVGLGTWLGKDIPEALFKQGMAAIILVSIIVMLWWERNKHRKVPNNWWFAGLMGLLVGFTTMIGNMAGAFSNLFFLAMRLPKDEFIGTAAWLFFIINLFKVPFHLYVWETIRPETLVLNFYLIPGIIIGLLIGIRLVKIIKSDHYRQFILLMTALGALVIFFK
ncbi:MAG: sulfite exporter TauE/SafE family protein [Bacteroidota bacterium]